MKKPKIPQEFEKDVEIAETLKGLSVEDKAIVKGFIYGLEAKTQK